MTKQIGLFVEDFGHETVIQAILQRYAQMYHLDIAVQSRSVRGGLGRMIRELRQYLRDVHRDPAAATLDALIIARDANCKGQPERRRELEEAFQRGSLAMPPVYAIPDPHIERWLLLDSKAFKQALGSGCQAPDSKCERGRYKRLLSEAVRAAGLSPLLNGLEHAEAIINAMNLDRMQHHDASLGQFLQDVETLFQLWEHE